MPINLGKGEFYIMQGDKCINLGQAIPEVEFEESANETVSISHMLGRSPELSLSINSMDLDILDNLYTPATLPDNITIEYYTTIMIQARWHKKPRIRKKWLKRFGLKPDTIKVNADVRILEYQPGHILDEQRDDSGICATFDNWELEVNKLEYILRPDQKRKGLMFEW